MNANTEDLVFTDEQVETMIQEEIREVGGIDGLTKVLGTDAFDFIDPEDADNPSRGTTFTFGEREKQVLIKDYIDRLDDPISELCKLFGDQSFIRN